MIKRGSGVGPWIAVITTVAALVVAAVIVWRAVQGPGVGPASLHFRIRREARPPAEADAADPLEGTDVTPEERRHLEEILKERGEGTRVEDSAR